MMNSISDLPTGEQQLKRREQRIWAIKGSLFVLGLVTGGMVGYLTAENSLVGDAKWPPAIAVSLALIYVIAIGAGSLLLKELCDEVERQNNYKAIAFAGTVYMMGYPVWFLLWKGDLAPEPIHWVLFAAFYVSLLGAYLYYRYR